MVDWRGRERSANVIDARRRLGWSKISPLPVGIPLSDAEFGPAFQRFDQQEADRLEDKLNDALNSLMPLDQASNPRAVNTTVPRRPAAQPRKIAGNPSIDRTKAPRSNADPIGSSLPYRDFVERMNLPFEVNTLDGSMPRVIAPLADGYRPVAFDDPRLAPENFVGGSQGKGNALGGTTVDPRVISTIIAEAIGGGYDGMLAVANVINNRARKSGKDPLDIVKAPSQFEGYSNPGKGVSGALKDPAVRARVEQMWNGVVNATLPDPTNGGTMFHAKNSTPYWASAENKYGTQNIGGNVFYLGNKPRPVSPEVPPRRPDTPTVQTAQAADPGTSAVNAINSVLMATGQNPIGDVNAYATPGTAVPVAPTIARPSLPTTSVPIPLKTQNAVPASTGPTIKAYDVTGKTWGDFRAPQSQSQGDPRLNLGTVQQAANTEAAQLKARLQTALSSPPSGLTTRKVQSVAIDPKTGSVVGAAAPPPTLQASLEARAAQLRATAPSDPVYTRTTSPTPTQAQLVALRDPRLPAPTIPLPSPLPLTNLVANGRALSGDTGGLAMSATPRVGDSDAANASRLPLNEIMAAPGGAGYYSTAALGLGASGADWLPRATTMRPTVRTAAAAPTQAQLQALRDPRTTRALPAPAPPYGRTVASTERRTITAPNLSATLAGLAGVAIPPTIPRPPTVLPTQSQLQAMRDPRQPVVPQRLTPSAPGMLSPGSVPGFGMAEVEQIGLPLSAYVDPRSGRRVTGEAALPSVPLPRPRPTQLQPTIQPRPVGAVPPDPMPRFARPGGYPMIADPPTGSTPIADLVDQLNSPGAQFLAWLNNESLEGRRHPMIRAVIGMPQVPRPAVGRGGPLARLFGNNASIGARPMVAGIPGVGAVATRPGNPGNPVVTTNDGRQGYAGDDGHTTEIQRLLGYGRF